MYLRKLLEHESLLEDPETKQIKLNGILGENEHVVDVLRHLDSNGILLLIATMEELIHAIRNTS